MKRKGGGGKKRKTEVKGWERGNGAWRVAGKGGGKETMMKNREVEEDNDQRG